MKTLFLIRHAKSSWNFPELDDHDRPLNRRGRESLPIMCKRIQQHGWHCQQMLSSSAVRALSTAESLVEAICDQDLVKVTSELYSFDVDQVFDLLLQQSDEYQTLAIVGHNPAFEMLLEILISDPPPEKFPTCAIARIELDIDHWSQLAPASGQLIDFEYPKKKQD